MNNQKFVQLLKLPYPESNSRKEIWLSSIFIATLAYLFLIVFQPFGTYNFANDFKYLLLLPYSLILFLVISAVNFITINKIARWNILKEGIKIIIAFAICAIINYWYNITFITHTDFTIYGLYSMFLFTFALGIPVGLIYFLSRYIYLKRVFTAYNRPIQSTPANQRGEETIITINADAGANHLSLLPSELLFAESSGNYCTIYYLRNNVVEKQLLRLALKNLEEQINCGTIIRCHKSFVVNINKIINATGNAQGYKLTIEHTEATVPVSRSYISSIRKVALNHCHS